jgi:glucokinase
MIACIDIGASKTRVGFSDNGVSFTDVKNFETFVEFKDQILRLVSEVTPNAQKLEKIAIGCAGTIDRKEGKVTWWGQRPSWWGQSLFGPLATLAPSAKLFIENDADMATLGEAVFGAGKRFSIVGYLTLSSGIGGGLVIDKKIVTHKYGFEPGHQIININETNAWSCGQKGCFESYASGTAFQKTFGMAGEECNDAKIWEQYAGLLAPGLANAIALWSPEVIILGGGISTKANFFLEPLRKRLKELIPFELPEVLQANLGESGLYGGLALN